MNPPQSINPEYDKGYADGYRDRGIEQVVIDLREVKNMRPEDFQYLAEICNRFPHRNTGNCSISVSKCPKSRLFSHTACDIPLIGRRKAMLADPNVAVARRGRKGRKHKR